jgi:hypothetical protein
VCTFSKQEWIKAWARIHQATLRLICLANHGSVPGEITESFEQSKRKSLRSLCALWLRLGQAHPNSHSSKFETGILVGISIYHIEFGGGVT